jgi:hypothetical protein
MWKKKEVKGRTLDLAAATPPQVKRSTALTPFSYSVYLTVIIYLLANAMAII